MKRKTSLIGNSTDRLPLRFPFLQTPLVIAFTWFALAPQAKATCQEGCSTNDNTVLGEDALRANTTGSLNTAIGWDALVNSTSGSNNTAIGATALQNNMAGSENTATGVGALSFNTGSNNTATGVLALTYNTGSNNTATGHGALSNPTGSDNTAMGSQALLGNTTGNYNTATGDSALYSNRSGPYNTATGYQTLYTNSTGGYNTATGFASLAANTTGYFNAADGVFTLFTNSTGYQNAAAGVSALYGNTTGHNNTAVGYQALGGNTTGNGNIAIGSKAGVNLTTGSNNIDIGANVLGIAAESDTIRIGKQNTHQKTFIAGIYGKTVSSGTGLFINSNGQLGTVVSSARFKEQVRPMAEISEAILGLKPVTFHYKNDSESTPQFGLIAEQVERVNPDLVIRDNEGKPYTVRYEAVNAMLLNEFLKEHKTVQEQKATIAQLKKNFAEQQKQIEALTDGLQKVSARLELNRPAPRTIVKNH